MIDFHVSPSVGQFAVLDDQRLGKLALKRLRDILYVLFMQVEKHLAVLITAGIHRAERNVDTVIEFRHDVVIGLGGIHIRCSIATTNDHHKILSGFLADSRTSSGIEGGLCFGEGAVVDIDDKRETAGEKASKRPALSIHSFGIIEHAAVETQVEAV